MNTSDSSRLIPAHTRSSQNSPDNGPEALASGPTFTQPLHATSQGFYPQSPPEVLRRSLIISIVSGAIGIVFFSVIQGTVFNFFLEELSLRDRLPYFMGLWCVAGLGTLVGSWIQSRWGYRKSLFLICAGGSRFIWLAIGLIPWLWPDLAKADAAFTWLTILTLLFFFVHAIGANAWLSWMADLVPAHLQNRYWSLRQVACSGVGMAARLGVGYYLSEGFLRNPDDHFSVYATLFILATVFGVVDAAMFLFVEHRRPRKKTAAIHVTAEFIRRIKELPFQRLCSVYLLWSVSNCIIGPTLFFIMRDQVGMGVRDISVIETLSLLALTVFSLIWGKFSDRHGQRGSLFICILIHAFTPLAIMFANRGDDWLVGITMVMGTVGVCGITLFMFPLLINYTQGSGGGREFALAVFGTVLNLSSFVAFYITDQYLYDSLGWYFNTASHSTPVYMAAIAIGMVLRFCAAGICLLLPKTENETPPGVLIQYVVTTNPLRATFNFFKYVTGQEQLETLEEQGGVKVSNAIAESVTSEESFLNEVKP